MNTSSLTSLTDKVRSLVPPEVTHFIYYWSFDGSRMSDIEVATGVDEDVVDLEEEYQDLNGEIHELLLESLPEDCEEYEFTYDVK